MGIDDARPHRSCAGKLTCPYFLSRTLTVTTGCEDPTGGKICNIKNRCPYLHRSYTHSWNNFTCGVASCFGAGVGVFSFAFFALLPPSPPTDFRFGAMAAEPPMGIPLGAQQHCLDRKELKTPSRFIPVSCTNNHFKSSSANENCHLFTFLCAADHKAPSCALQSSQRLAWQLLSHTILAAALAPEKQASLWTDLGV